VNDSYHFSRAEETDRETVMALYAACRSLPGCTWSDDYPSQEEFAGAYKLIIFCR
jgi:hypothetical protein